MVLGGRVPASNAESSESLVCVQCYQQNCRSQQRARLSLAKATFISLSWLKDHELGMSQAPKIQLILSPGLGMISWLK